MQLKECIVKSTENTTEMFELEEETFMEAMDLADVGFVKIERALSKYGIKEGRDEMTEDERTEMEMADLILAADYLQ